MARKRPGLVATRRVVAGVLVFVGVFVLCFGLGNGSQAIMITGAAIALLSVAFRLVATLRGSIRQWVVGTGRVIHVSEAPTGTPYGRCELQLVVEAADLPQETVIIREPRVPVDQWPYVGQELPIEVAADDVRNVRILWPGTRESAALIDDDEESDPLWDDDQPDPVPAEPPGSHLDLDEEDDVHFDLDGPPTWQPPPAQSSPADEGRVGQHVALAEEQPSQLVPRPRPSPRPSPRPRPAPEGAAMSVAHPEAFASYPSAHPGPSGSVHRIGVTLLVSDLTASVRFYRDTLGFHEVDTSEDIAVLASGETRLVLYASREMKPVNRRVTHLNLDVADIDALYADLKAAGVRFTYAPRKVSEGLRMEQWAAAFRDPDGHGIALTQWRPRAG